MEWDDNFEEEPLLGVEEELDPRTKTMNASLGQPLTLRLEEISLRVTPERVIDPVRLGEYETPSPAPARSASSYA